MASLQVMKKVKQKSCSTAMKMKVKRTLKIMGRRMSCLKNPKNKAMIVHPILVRSSTFYNSIQARSLNRMKTKKVRAVPSLRITKWRDG